MAMRLLIEVMVVGGGYLHPRGAMYIYLLPSHAIFTQKGFSSGIMIFLVFISLQYLHWHCASAKKSLMAPSHSFGRKLSFSGVISMFMPSPQLTLISRVVIEPATLALQKPVAPLEHGSPVM